SRAGGERLPRAPSHDHPVARARLPRAGRGRYAPRESAPAGLRSDDIRGRDRADAAPRSHRPSPAAAACRPRFRRRVALRQQQGPRVGGVGHPLCRPGEGGVSLRRASAPAVSSRSALLVCLAAVLPSSVVAQGASPYVPLHHWAMPYVEHLIARGALADPTPRTRPLHADDLVRALEAADTTQLTAAERRIVRDILADL